MPLPLALLMKKLREHMTPLMPLDLQGAIGHLVYLTRHKLQVTLLHTEVEKKRHNGGRQREDFHRAEGSAETDLQRRQRLLAGLRPPRATIGRGDHDLRTPPSAVGAATSARRPWPLVL